MIPQEIRRAVDTALRGRDEFTHAAIEEELAKHYAIGDDEPTVDDDEFHNMITEFYAHYQNLGKTGD